MGWYLNEIDKYPILNRKEERELLIAAKAGNRAAYDKLIVSNLKFVVSIAKRYQKNNGSLTLDDLISEGNIGLMKALDRYELSKKVKFITYAVWWIRQTILNSIHQNAKTIRIPINKLTHLQKIQDLKSELSIPSRKEACEYTMVNLDQDCVEGNNLHNIISLNPEEELDSEFLEEFNDLMTGFTEKEQQITKMYFGLLDKPYTLKEIGAHFSLTRERVRQIKEKVIRKLRRGKYKETLRIYLC